MSVPVIEDISLDSDSGSDCKFPSVRCHMKVSDKTATVKPSPRPDSGTHSDPELHFPEALSDNNDVTGKDN